MRGTRQAGKRGRDSVSDCQETPHVGVANGTKAKPNGLQGKYGGLTGGVGVLVWYRQRKWGQLGGNVLAQ